MSIWLLYAILVLCTVAVLGVAGAIYWRVRKHMRASADARLREALEEIEHQRQTTRT